MYVCICNILDILLNVNAQQFLESRMHAKDLIVHFYYISSFQHTYIQLLYKALNNIYVVAT